MWTCNETFPFTLQGAEYRKSGTEAGFVFLVCSPVDPLLHFLFVVKLSATFHVTLHHTYQWTVLCSSGLT